MDTKIFVNLPVKDLNKTMGFFSQLGFKFNPQFTDQNAACMIIGEDAYIMLLVKPFFQTFIPKEISDATQNTEAIVSLTAGSKEEVNDIVNKAVEAGATTYRDPSEQEGMYSWGFQDVDGHIWDIFYMDPSVLESSTSADISE